MGRSTARARDRRSAAAGGQGGPDGRFHRLPGHRTDPEQAGTALPDLDHRAGEASRGPPAVQHQVDTGEEVRVEVPVSLVDAFLSGEGEEGNMEAAVAELQKRRGDIVRVKDDDSNVRIWIDEQSSQR